MNLDYFGKKPKELLDNEPIEVIMDGEWKRFGKLKFNDRIWTDDQLQR